MGFFINLLKRNEADDLEFESAVVESLNSPVKYSSELEKRNDNRLIYRGNFTVQGRDLTYKLEIHPKDRTAYFLFKTYVSGISTVGSLNILTPRQTLSVFSTLKEILLEHIDEFDQLEYDAADKKLLRFYITLASKHFPDFKHLIQGLKGTLTKNGTTRKEEKFEIRKIK